MELDRQAARQPRPLHQQLLFRQDRIAGIARFPVAWTTPDSRDLVVWQAAVLDLAPDEKTEGFVVHSGLAGSGSGDSQIHRGPDARERQTMRPRCRRRERSTDG